ncbi:tRNA epoxyqueuosine(34) reductase QueG [Celerinatantimonas sp. MCCC 1A17872]|uniref:tRNA epoxyqueuosine(34) reductase QueG n=1 Tax=Celerinatantimonas sp. MCCC 1A17872 TaxID=3177514 RepID=UPI0038C38CB4
MAENSKIDFNQLALDIKQWGKQLGFAQVGITDTDVSDHIQSYRDWLSRGYHGEMSFMQRNQQLREDPAQLHPGTLRVISVRMNYLISDAGFASTLKNPNRAYISRYALGRDYHKVLRKRLKKLAEKIKTVCESLDYRPFVDSAPLMERPLAEKAGLGWTGKHTLLIHPCEGSWFFLGELLVNLPLPTDNPIEPQCGNCVACMTLCPTGAITQPYTIDARRCISYLTIENPGSIAEEFRPLMGNRIYGCDDCQLACPYNRQSQLGEENDFLPRHELDKETLLELFAWDEATFLAKTQGSPIRRIGHERWQRNIAVALGNAPTSIVIIQALEDARTDSSELVKEHIDWALNQHYNQLQVVTRQTSRLIRIVEKGLARDA